MNFPRPRSWKTAARVGAVTLLGAAAGLAYWWQVGCATGGCPLTSDPVVTTLFGGAFGATMSWPSEGLFGKAPAVATPPAPQGKET